MARPINPSWRSFAALSTWSLYFLTAFNAVCSGSEELVRFDDRQEIRNHPHGLGHLSKRAPTPDYQAAITKGNTWICHLTQEAPPDQVTKFKDPIGDINNSGWSKLEDSSGSDYLTELADALKANGITDLSSFRDVGMMQTEKVSGQQESSCALYVEIYDTVSGTIIPTMNYNAQSQCGTSPPMGRWSDVVFLKWKELCETAKTNPNTIKQFFRYHIVPKGTTTQAIALIAANVNSVDDLKSMDASSNTIDGQTFDAASEQGKAIIGTPHGQGIAWFLWQHQYALGKKTFDRITLFKTTVPGYQDVPTAWLNIHFLLKDA